MCIFPCTAYGVNGNNDQLGDFPHLVQPLDGVGHIPGFIHQASRNERRTPVVHIEYWIPVTALSVITRQKYVYSPAGERRVVCLKMVEDMKKACCKSAVVKDGFLRPNNHELLSLALKLTRDSNGLHAI
jgi:hypothetical protein